MNPDDSSGALDRKAAGWQRVAFLAGGQGVDEGSMPSVSSQTYSATLVKGGRYYLEVYGKGGDGLDQDHLSLGMTLPPSFTDRSYFPMRADMLPSSASLTPDSPVQTYM